MVILEVSVPTLGRFLVHDDYSMEEVLYIPGIYEDSPEVQTLGQILQENASPFRYYLNVLEASLVILYGAPVEVTVHTNNQPEVLPDLIENP